MTRPIYAVLSALLALGFLAALSPLAVAADPCVTTGSGYQACGSVQVVACGTGSAAGTSTGPVHWELDVLTNHGNAYDYAYGNAAALHASAPCWTDTCTQAILYADGVVVDRTLIVC